MTTITASLVKELRDKTGAGMMDCKTALTEMKGDIESAVDWLRKKGLSKAANKAGRIAAEGLIGVIAKDKARRDGGGQLGDRLRRPQRAVPGHGAQRSPRWRRRPTAISRSCWPLTYPGKSATVEDHVKEMVATIGENMSVRRTVAMSVGDGHVAEYVHNKVADGLGKIGVLVALESKGDKAALAGFGRQLAMHIAAAAPAAVTAEELDPALIERERAVYTEQAKASGKSDDIAAKMVEGRLRKEFYQQVVLMQQTFLGAGGDGKATVAQVLKEAEKTAGAPIKIAKFARYALGEGIDKKDDDFAAEVAKAAGKR